MAKKKIAKKKSARKVKKTAGKAMKKAAKKAPKKAAKKTARKVAKRAPAKKVAKKLVKKAPPKPAPRPAIAAKPMPKPPIAAKPMPTSPIAAKPAVAAAPRPMAPAAAPPVPVMAPPPPMPAVGTFAPDFELMDGTGRAHRLSDYRGRKAVLYFYPKDDTPGCTTEACGFRDAYPKFTEHNVVVLGISPDTVESHTRFADKFGLPFPLLADPDHAVAEQYGVWVQKNMYGNIGMGIARTTFIIDADGRIAHVFTGVKADGHEQVVLSQLTGGQPPQIIA
jgi:peroxiredoxin Q/BCP